MLAETYTRKNGETISLRTEQKLLLILAIGIFTDYTPMSTLWVGTSLGSVLTVAITLPDPDNRQTSPVVVTILGK